MIKSINMMKSRRYNIVGHAIANVLQFISCPTDIVRRAALVFALMMAVFGNVEAGEIEIKDYKDENGAVIPASYFVGVLEGSILRVHLSSEGQIYLATAKYKKLWPDSDYNEYYGPTTKYYDSSTGNYEFELTEEILKNISDDGGLMCYKNWGGPIDRVTIITVEKDNFPGFLPAGIESKKLDISLTVDKLSYAFDFSEVKTEELKYVRYYLLSGKKAQDITGKISINNGNGKTFADNPSRGTYIYKNGAPLDDDDLKGTLNIPAKDLYGKTLVVVFSEKDLDEVTPKEPELSAMYEYTFTKGVIEKNITRYIDKSLNKASFSIADLEKQIEGFSLSEMQSDFSIKWSVVKGSDKQALLVNANATDWGFVAYNYNEIKPYTITDNVAMLDNNYSNYDGNTFTGRWNEWNINNPQISCPTGEDKTFNDYEDCHVVCEITAAEAYHIIYSFYFTKNGVEPDPFEGDFDETKTENRKHSVTVTDSYTELDFTLDKEGMKYARFYLTDKYGNLYGGNGDAIYFDGKTATDVAKRGFYLYNEEGLLDDLKVTVKLPKGSFYDYKLIAVFSDSEPTMNDEGTMAIKEPNISKKYVYDFIIKAINRDVFKYIDWSKKSMPFSIEDLEEYLDGFTLGDIKNNFSITWYVQDGEGTKQLINQDNSWRFIVNEEEKPFKLSSENTSVILTQDDFSDGNIESKWTDWNIKNPTISCPSEIFKKYNTYGAVCEVKSETHNITYKFLFSRGGVLPDSFENDFDYNKIEKKTEKVGISVTEKEIDFSSVLTDNPNIKYVRFYLVNNENDILFADNKNALKTKDGQLTDVEVRGYYLYNEEGLENDDLKVTVKLNNGQFYDYNLVAVFSDDSPAMEDNKVVRDAIIKRMIECRFIPDSEMFAFVHSKGITNRPFITNSNDNRISGSSSQYVWSGECTETQGQLEKVSERIRQGVHTVEYNMYVDPKGINYSTEYMLNLPFQYYGTGGQELEPSAYIRWYDWTTDTNHSRLVKKGSCLQELKNSETGESYGYFLLNTDKLKTYHGNVGVNFDAKDLNESDVVTIACDVSKYYDGIIKIDGFCYMVHEPTLSTRYIFNIRHASVIAKAIAAGQKKLNDGQMALNEGKSVDKFEMFNLAEDNGRFCVSIKDNSTKFSVRSECPRISDYYLFNNSNELVQCAKLQWKAYYEDEKGIWEKPELVKDNEDQTDKRIQTFPVSALDGTYRLLSNTNIEKEVKAGNGYCFHLVGEFVTSDGIVSPAIHYEMNFLEAPAYHSKNIPTERKGAYLKENMMLQAELTFDDYFMVDGKLSTNPGTQETNHIQEPLDWNEVEYGFCYPQLDKFRVHVDDTDYQGMSPLHGDYILLKTMNVPGVSEKGKGPDDATYPYKYNWWVADKLEDYTYRFGGRNEYGGFLYVDASDESRTIAKLRFKANLCVGAELCYTAVVADMTNGTTKPRLMTALYAVYKDGTQKHVASFLSCDLSEVATDFKSGLWYQVYGKITVPTNMNLSNGDVDYYEVHVDNYATNTDGADYCVDQIMYFINNAKLKVEQKSAACDDDAVDLNAYIKADFLEAYKGQNIYWRIYDENKQPLANLNGMYGDDESLTYGTLKIPSSIPETLTSKKDFIGENGYLKDDNGTVLFSVVNKKLSLEQGNKYYISLYSVGEIPEKENGEWGNPDDVCSVYSPVFVPRRMYLSLIDGDGNAQTSVNVGCSGNGDVIVNLEAVINVPDDDEATGFNAYHDVTFDYFMGSLVEYNSYKKNVVNLSEALADYRGKNAENKKYNEIKGLDGTYENEKADYYNVIKDAVDKGLLFLDCSKVFNHSISATKGTVSALPIEDFVEKNTTQSDGASTTIDIAICSPLEFTFDVNATGDGPTMQLGFEDVTYPEDYVRVVRVGREQLLNMQKDDGYLLHVPVNKFSIGSGDDNTGALVIVGNLELLKEGTTDPTISGNNNKVATFAADEEVSAEQMYVSLNFHGEGVTQPDFREGFAYRMFFQVKKKDAGEGACTGNVEFIMKVVPEFVTWNGNAGNTSWNNDANWTRSKCEELYKHDGQNTPTAAQGDGTNNGKYVDNDDATLGRPDTYVPMKFTYVTMPTHNRAPVLAALTKGIDGIYNNVESGATENIQYDIMVRTETVCMDENHAENGNSSIYDCEKFYGNCCKEIYFKPEAELVNQQHLMYEKAWVEKELVPAAWYLMSSPLRSVCSGDMFVPKSNGRQETEAFQPIAFGDTYKLNEESDTYIERYSRTKYPIYQRSWKQEGAEVYTVNEDWKDYNDPPHKTYSANLPYSKVVEKTMAQWSHVYNDVVVRDTTLAGFSIRAHKEKQAKNALLRLPKKKAIYSYYLWNDEVGNAGSWEIEKHPTSHGRFKTDGSDNATLSTGLKGTLKIYYYDSNQDKTIFIDSPDGEQTDLIQVNNGYALIGNPYMSSVRMSKFLEQNSSMIDGNAFWTYEVSDDGTSTELRAHGGSGTIRPMQAFFVKLKGDVVETGEIMFTSDMMIDGNTSPETEPANAGVRMTVANSKGQSTAVVAHVDGSSNGYDVGEDVETFFDSNFSDAPTVYTVAGTKAVSVNSLPNIDIVPFGVTCAGNDAVDVTITGTDLITQKLYVYDAANGMCAEIHDGEPISVQPNDYGRYYLTTRSSMSLDGNIAQGIVVSVRDGHVTVTSAKNISRVVVTTLNGANQLSLADCGMSATFTLHQGVYIIEVEGDAGKNTVKIMVK